MRLIRFILIDLALMLLAPENARAMPMATSANFKSATKAVGSLMLISDTEPVFSSGVSRHLHGQTSQAAPFGHSAEALGPANQAETLALLERRFASHWQAHRAAPSDCHDPRGAEMLNKPLVLTPICSPPTHLMPSREQRRCAGAAQTGLSHASPSSPLQRLCS
ncbi:hypothetical protein [Bradyrhizobium sp. LMG 9283]|uniref:hypothetical protein n=1 Tax=Bradyrhizobium sp. LMG 9283 TaxID=592064 RepID=UPI0038903563